MTEKTVGFAMTGSFCTFEDARRALAQTAAEFQTVVPILSEISAATDTRFGAAEDHRAAVEKICGRPPLEGIPSVEPFGPKKLLDLLIVAPCTGNTLGKLAHGITDSTVTMAVKAHLRGGRPVLLAISTNDGLGASGPNLMALLQRKHFFFVPFRQDDPEGKPASLKADLGLLVPAAKQALSGRQLQPLLLGP